MSSPERKLSGEEEAILSYLKANPRATTKDITANAEGLPRNRAIVENYLTRLFFNDDISMAREGRARVWEPNHHTVNLHKKPIAWVALPEDNERYGRRKLWFDLYKNVQGDDYIYVQESRFIQGEGWMNKAGIVVPLGTLSDFVANLLKVALKSDQFRKDYPEISDEHERFLKQISVHLGVTPLTPD